jgi:tetratricopeptide (TPR) repeat protein
MALASSAEKLKDRQAQRRHWEAAHRFDATESEPLRGLYDLAKEDHRDQDALDILWRLAPLEQHDRQVWRLLLKGLVDANDWPRARDVGSAAMYVDVLSAESHALYGKALAALGDHETAAFEFESASLCDKPAKESARILALWARELLALGRVDEAKLRRDAALKEDPQCAEARSIDLP